MNLIQDNKNSLVGEPGATVANGACTDGNRQLGGSRRELCIASQCKSRASQSILTAGILVVVSGSNGKVHTIPDRIVDSAVESRRLATTERHVGNRASM